MRLPSDELVWDLYRGHRAEPVAAVYRHALLQVYGYLLPRCGSAVVAEDLTAETFMAAVAAVRQGRAPGAEVAACLDRSEHATATLLVRARAALRRMYGEESSGDA